MSTHEIVSVYFPDKDLVKKLQGYADAYAISLSAVIVKAVENFIEKETWMNVPSEDNNK